MNPPFGLSRYRLPDGTERTYVLRDGEAVSVAALLPGQAVPSNIFADWSATFSLLAAAVDEAVSAGRWHTSAESITGLQVLPPVQPAQVFQSGANYRSHVVQLMMATARAEGADEEKAETEAQNLMDRRAAEGVPYVFLGLPSILSGADDDVVLPPTGKQHDWELELGVVIGHEASHVLRENAMDHVAGYVIVNDLTTRDRVFRPDMPGLGTDWLAGKNAPGFLPTGPLFVPAQFVPTPGELQITLSLNGRVMQDEPASDMIFDIPRLIEHVSAIVPMKPGDLLLTGSPAGNGAHYNRWLRPGDVTTSTITGLGTQVSRFLAYER